METLTDRNYWKEYWKNYEYGKIPSEVPFKKFLPKLHEINSFIEIGGFPGVYAAYFYKRGCPDVSLLDFYINKNTVNKFEKINNIPENTITCIESDFFRFETSKRYDFVFSYGFIEHFKNTKDVIARHCALMNQGERGTYLSGGEQQRIALARAILKNAPIVLLDEATAYADPENESKILSSFSHLIKGKTVLVIAHRLSTITNADRILLINNGTIEEQGTRNELLALKGYYARMWKTYSQAREWTITRKEEQK